MRRGEGEEGCQGNAGGVERRGEGLLPQMLITGAAEEFGAAVISPADASETHHLQL